ncbi:calcium-activated chloride channel regulator 1 [Plakobranchus ocellatus]|uniref:Calcium-activated chloride channel regulator 1 n=1 Tax=Plakobranchus ocellatus TaxID=259542 RepID=A0AAV4CF82_9GAST|nr:calcium-activated chloride channel regulator 1 [Plakobranchus ocellatus]
MLFSGADLERDDGIYSRYFTSFSNSGRYSLVLSVSDEVGASRLSSHLERITSGCVSSFKIVILSFPPHSCLPSTPFGCTIASEYVIVCSSNAEDLIRNIKLPKVPRSAVIEGNLGNPRSFGETEMITLQLGSVPDALPTALVLAVLAIDEAGNKADISNLVTVGLGLVPDVTTPEYQARQTKAAAEDPTMVSNLTLAIVVGVSGALLVTTFISTVLIYAIMRTGWMAKDRAERREKSGIV